MNSALTAKLAVTQVVPCQLHRARDDADLALLAYATPEVVARRFDRLVFGRCVARERAAGELWVTASRPQAQSRERARAGFDVRAVAVPALSAA
jgi:hypothetical protein